jgi:hypothetical protein
LGASLLAARGVRRPRRRRRRRIGGIFVGGGGREFIAVLRVLAAAQVWFV